MTSKAPHTVMVEFWMPIWRNFTVAASSPEAACAAALSMAERSDHTTWRDGVEETSAYRVARLAAGAHDNAQDAEERDVLPVPPRFSAPTTLQVNVAGELVRAAQAMLDAFGGSVPDWIAPEFAALAGAVAASGGRA